MNYNSEFEDKLDSINNTAKRYGFKNGVDWARTAEKAGEISSVDYSQYKTIHGLRVGFSHGHACEINISYATLEIAKRFERDILRSRLRKTNNPTKEGPRLPDGTFRAPPFRKEIVLDGASGRKYVFNFEIVKEYQERAYDDGTRFKGVGFTIYVQNSPYNEWCLLHNRESEFHFYHPRNQRPSICWNHLITDFEDANAIMLVWAKRYVKILDPLIDKKKVDYKKVENNKKAHILPSGTFRHQKYKKQEKLLTFHIPQPVYKNILNILGKRKPELGGMLGWKDDEFYIDYFIFDKKAVVGNSEYNPNTSFLNKVINGKWAAEGIYLGGFVHSHPGNSNMLSPADVEYAMRIMEEFEIEFLFMPIVTSSYAFKATFNPYVVFSDGRVQKARIIVDKPYVAYNQINKSIDEDKERLIEEEFDKMSNPTPITISDVKEETLFARINTCLDIDYLNECTVIGVGCGGAKSFYESMARMGVGNFYLIDGDISSLSNVATQNAYLDEVGVKKTDALKRRLLAINAEINVHSYPFMLNDDIDDEFLENEIISKINPAKCVLCAFTDDFYAQARLNNIALKYRIPFICGQHHEFGITSEVIFWYPGITKFSLKEIANSRYQSFKNGYTNVVTSVGSPIFNTTRLNSICEKIAIGLLLYGNSEFNSSYCEFVKKMSKKNLILIRERQLDESHPLFALFKSNKGSFFDDVVWINPKRIEKEIIEAKPFEGDTRKIF